MFRLRVARAEAADYARTPTGRPRAAEAARRAGEAEKRRRWRALLLVVKARLVAVDDGVETLELAFLSWVVLPDGSTVAEWLGPQLDAVYATAQMPALLTGAAGAARRRRLTSPLPLHAGRRRGRRDLPLDPAGGWSAQPGRRPPTTRSPSGRRTLSP